MDNKGVSAKIMAEIDRRACEEYGMSQIALMENAGRSAASVIMAGSRNLSTERIAVFCGKGNNGGDGFVASRFLSNVSPERLTVYVRRSDTIKSSTAIENKQIIRKMGIDIRFTEDLFKEGDIENIFTIAVDAVYGTGFTGELPEEYAFIGRMLNMTDIKVYSLDVPSGLDSTTGKASIDCFKAFKTISFGLPKQGFFIKDGPDVCGEIIIDDIGFPHKLLSPYL